MRLKLYFDFKEKGFLTNAFNFNFNVQQLLLPQNGKIQMKLDSIFLTEKNLTRSTSVNHLAHGRGA